jgi:ribosomal protein S18 acetylase RimI-like enzyme
MTLAEAEKKATTQADAENHACVVCENAEGKIVGYAWYAWQEAESEKSVFGICIRRGYQEVGTGQAVMRRVLEIAESVGPATMTLTVQKANARAVALYTKMGFRPVRDQERPACYGFDAEPEYYMECSVRNP